MTHVLLPVLFFSRRADSARVVGRAVELVAGGLGRRVVAGLLGRPLGTVRGWLRSAGVAARAGPEVFGAMAAEVAPDAARVAPGPAGSLVGGLVASLSALAAAVGARWGVAAPGWEAVGAAACRCRLLQASWWASKAQHELALPPPWWAGPGLV
ncbi:MAG: hypothetical protein LBG60_09920 [Bifidobacteriaceae bacterium]|nr:hypothetical protein [Bifidobacteriaceae bacterium]